MELLRLLPLFSIIIAFVGVVLSSILPREKSRLCAYICEWLSCACGIGVLIYAINNGNTVFQMGHLSYGENGEPLYWLNNVIRFGVSEGLFATVFPPILFFCLLGGQRKLQEDLSPKKERLYYVLANLVLVALTALIYADDIFTCYVFLEISTLSSIGLIAIKDKGRTTVAAIRYMIFNLVGSGLYLIGIVLLYDLTGYFMLEKIQEVLSSLAASGTSLPVITFSLTFITIGLGIKSGLFPFHFWMADTYGESTTASAGIISGLISKGYIILLIKMLFRAFGYSANGTVGVASLTPIPNILFYLGIGGLIFGSISAIFEKRINKMIAYSSAAQIGYIYLALGLGTVGIPAATVQILAHAITKPLLFLTARGLIEVSDHKPQFNHLRGAGFRNPFAAIMFTFGALSMIGFPVTAGFIVKYSYIKVALLQDMSSLLWTVSALVISTLLNTCYFIHTVITLYSPEKLGEAPIPITEHHNKIGYTASVISLALMNVALGAVPWVISFVLSKSSLV